MKYKIKTTTTQTDYKGKSIFDRAADELMIDETFSTMDEEGTIETSLYGELEFVGDTYTLFYEEETEGMGGVNTEIRFDTRKPYELSIARTGAIDAFMYFEKGKRHICVYNTGIMPFEICIYAKEVDNRLLTDGYLEINYLIEIKGACAQKTVFKMEIEKV
ncbi:MAG: DUF1934 domain-containing protein [Ruminococcaceae bacterium]|nr:DUF1934 domain-containing protein [Oscillospiraceae bacterium]